MAEAIKLPGGNEDELELLLSWLDYLRGAVMRKVEGLDERGAHWRPDDRLISLIGIVKHLTGVEWRWIDGGLLGASVSRSEEEFHPGPELLVADALAAYRERAQLTNAVVRRIGVLTAPCQRAAGTDLRWVLLHLVNETARHAGHADATRELFDGLTGK